MITAIKRKNKKIHQNADLDRWIVKYFFGFSFFPTKHNGMFILKIFLNDRERYIIRV